ncbi:hypothetical protein [Actinoplanes sp. NPDC051859]|uniref:hypothetical protein n=1 Tax=Actinoplanes sp. NPDC051859 TaxID=3363909 RepID=UPI00379B1097
MTYPDRRQARHRDPDDRQWPIASARQAAPSWHDATPPAYYPPRDDWAGGEPVQRSADVYRGYQSPPPPPPTEYAHFDHRESVPGREEPPAPHDSFRDQFEQQMIGDWAPPVSDRQAWEPQVTEHDLYWASVRIQAASVVREVNFKHCHVAFERLGSRHALSPLCVILLYAAPDPRQATGFRMFHTVRHNYTGPVYDNVERLLPGLTEVARTNIDHAAKTGRRWDPRGPERSMVNVGDLDMPRTAQYIGTALASLSIEHRDWHTSARTVAAQPVTTARTGSVFDLPGQAFVLLTDGTAMHVRRDPTLRFGDDGVRSTHTLTPGRSYHRLHSDLTDSGGEQTRTTWRLLTDLHDTLTAYLLRDHP